MGKTLIRVDCIDQRLYIAAAPAVASGGKNEDAVEFSFCPLWEGFTKTGVFYRSEDDVYHAIVSGDRCIIPHEVLKEEGTLFFGVFGVKGDITRTSEIVKYRVVKGTLTEGTQPSDPTPDIYAQILNQYGAMDTRVVNLEKFAAGSEPYEITGNPVRLENFEGMPMNVVSRLEPIQSGSGDPYPAGCGKNLLPFMVKGKTFSANGMTANVTDEGMVVNGTPSGSYNNLAYHELMLPAGTYTISGGNTANGVIAQLNVTNADGSTSFYSNTTFEVKGTEQRIVAMIQNGGTTPTMTNYALKAQLERGSVATEFALYENIRPITGRTGTELVRCGKNLCPGFESGGYDNTNGGTFNSSTYQRTKKIPITEGATYTHSTSKGWGPNDIHFWDKNGAHLGRYESLSVLNNRPAGAAYVAFNYYQQEITWVQLELGSAASPFEPYQGDTYALNFGQTVYGGTLDWIKGELTTPDNRARAFDGTEGWGQASSAANTFYLDYYNSGGSAGSPVLLDAICSHYKTSKSTTLASSDMAYYPLSYSGAIYRHAFTDSRFSTVAQWKAYLAEQAAAGTPVQAIEKLPTPTTIQLTPQQITALAGVNTVYSDADEVTVSGRKDILWLTSDLVKQIAELKNAIISLGGNV